MERKEVIAKLRELKASGVDIGIALNRPTQKLQDRYLSLSNKDNRLILDDNLLRSVLAKLALDKLYRLYRLSSRMRKIIDTQYFWRLLIERDLGVVPKFRIDLKLHYLRATRLPFAGTIWKAKNNKDYKQAKPRDKVIALLEKGGYVTSDQRVHLSNGTEFSLSPERFKKTIPYSEGDILSYSGKTCTFAGEWLEESQVPISDTLGSKFLGKDGILYLPNEELNEPISGQPERFIAINNQHQLLSETGILYQFEYTDVGYQFTKLDEDIEWISGSKGIKNGVPIENAHLLGTHDSPILAIVGDLGFITHQLEFIDTQTYIVDEHRYRPKAQGIENVLEIVNHIYDYGNRSDWIRTLDYP